MFNAKATNSNIEADLYLPTLDMFRGRAKGSFSLTDLKRMMAKKAFLDLKDSARRGAANLIYQYFLQPYRIILGPRNMFYTWSGWNDLCISKPLINL